jgi:acetolactate synthase-1/3 small subunit
VLLAGLTEDIADLFQQLNSYNCLLQYTRSGRIAVTRSFDEPISDYLKQNSED